MELRVDNGADARADSERAIKRLRASPSPSPAQFKLEYSDDVVLTIVRRTSPSTSPSLEPSFEILGVFD